MPKFASRDEILTCDTGGHPMFALTQDVTAGDLLFKPGLFRAVHPQMSDPEAGDLIHRCPACGGRCIEADHRHGFRLHFADGWRPSAWGTAA